MRRMAFTFESHTSCVRGRKFLRIDVVTHPNDPKTATLLIPQSDILSQPTDLLKNFVASCLRVKKNPIRVAPHSPITNTHSNNIHTSTKTEGLTQPREARQPEDITRSQHTKARRKDKEELSEIIVDCSHPSLSTKPLKHPEGDVRHAAHPGADEKASEAHALQIRNRLGLTAHRSG